MEEYAGRKTITNIQNPERLAGKGLGGDRVGCVTLTALLANTRDIWAARHAGVSARSAQQVGKRIVPYGSVQFFNVPLHEIWLDAEVADEGVTWNVD